MKNRTRSFITAVFMAAIVVAGCNTPIEPNPDLCDNIAGIQLTVPDGMVKEGRNCVPAPPELGTVTVAFDTPNPVIVQGDPVSCPRVEVIGSKNLPPGYVLDTALFLEDGMPVSCGSIAGVGPQLVSGTPPEPATAKLAIGPHSVTARVTLRGTDVKAESQAVGFTIAPPRERFVLTRVAGVYPQSGEREFCIGEIGGGVLECTNTGGKKYWPALSPNGKTWAYSKRDSTGLWFANRDGSNARNVELFVNGERIDPAVSPVWSPDGTKIVFTGTVSTGVQSRVLVMSADGTGFKRILPDCPSVLGYTTWLNDREVVTGCWVDSLMEYKVVDSVTGTDRTILVVGKGQIGYSGIIQDVSPNGEWVLLWELFTTRQATLLRTDGSGEIRRLTPEGIDAWEPFFCQHGERVCASSRPTEIFSIDLNGQDKRTVFTLSGGWIETPRRWP